MKRGLIATAFFSVAFLLASPAMALDADFTGYLYARGFFNSRVSLTDTPDANTSDAYLKSELRLQTVLDVSDSLTFTTRLGAFENFWGGIDMGRDPANVDLERAYLTVSTPFGVLDVGRMSDDLFGTTFLDDVDEKDRIRYALPLGDTTLYAIYEKTAGLDMGKPGTESTADQDQSSYKLRAVTKLPVGVAGVELNYEDDMRFGFQDRKEYHINPYFDLRLGTIAVQGELKYAWGDISVDQTEMGHAGEVPHAGDVTQGIDVNRFAANIESNIGLGKVNLTAGYAFMSGDDDLTDNEEHWFPAGTGEDWEKLWILTGSTDDTHMLLEGEPGAGPRLGNLASGDAADPTAGAAQHGAKIVYIGLSASPKENLTVGLIFGSSKAQKVPKGSNDEHGMEWDLTVDYQFLHNLSYSFIAAFLAPGDYWKGDDPDTDTENTYSIYNELKIKF